MAVLDGRAKDGRVVQAKAVQEVGKPALLVLYGEGEESIVELMAGVLGQASILRSSVRGSEDVGEETVVGVLNSDYDDVVAAEWTGSRLVINTHRMENGSSPEEKLSQVCDYEYLYTRSSILQRDIARYLSFILGQIVPHADLSKKERTTLISTTFADIHTALPNLDILSVGADAVELRVDLLKGPLPDGTFSPVPSLQYVGSQLMLLRQRTELPIIYTTRCVAENGRFPMSDPDLFHRYLLRAIQWGVEYIDVELWLPLPIRHSLALRKGHSKIISAFHDFSGRFKWTAPSTLTLFKQSAQHADVVKMIALATTMQDNYELEYFRSTIQAAAAASQHPASPSHPPFSGLNMGPIGHLSRTLNKVFTPITHPLLPMIAAPGQLSAAEINTALHSMGQMPAHHIYGLGSLGLAQQAPFFEKCFNELSLPHRFAFVATSPGANAAARETAAVLELIARAPEFGGAFLHPPLSCPAAEALGLVLSHAAREIGAVDTVVVGGCDVDAANVTCDNASWRAIRRTLTRDFVPSAYASRAALVLASGSETETAEAAAAVFALRSLGIGPIYTIGATSGGGIGRFTEPFRGVEDVKRGARPFVIVSALTRGKGALVGPLLKHYGLGRVFLELADDGGASGSGSGRLTPERKMVVPRAVAAREGWVAYGGADVGAWTTVEVLRLLVGQN
ncbi:putative pentafunctional AROM polypeptide, partial [Saccharata proteae CBS 121410]